MQTVAVVPGVNAVKCDCEDGTVFVPVSMRKMAKIRTGVDVPHVGKCHLGHRQTLMLKASYPRS